MIKTLQRKFIITAMTAVSVLLIVLLGAINAVNCWMVGEQGNRMLIMLSENEGMFPPPADLKEKGGHALFNPPINEDTAMSARYFSVRFGPGGEIVFIDTSRIASVAEDEAAAYAEKAKANGAGSGRMDRFKYYITDSRDGRGTVIVFLDISSQARSILTVLFISMSIGILCWGLMLLLVILLSRKAIRPIALNMEKQKQFVTNAGHEIKTPLAIILANTDAMELHNGENKWSRNIRTQTMRLDGLMQNLLTLSRTDEGGTKLTVSDFSYSFLLEETLHPFSESAKVRGITIKTGIKPEVIINANREQLQRLISILFDNAVKYTDSGGIIEITLEKHDSTATLKVKNTCQALPEGNPEKLFDRFYRGDAARTQKSGGYGIGLSAARAIAESHKGTITAHYESKNIIVFTVKL